MLAVGLELDSGRKRRQKVAAPERVRHQKEAPELAADQSQKQGLELDSGQMLRQMLMEQALESVQIILVQAQELGFQTELAPESYCQNHQTRLKAPGLASQTSQEQAPKHRTELEPESQRAQGLVVDQTSSHWALVFQKLSRAVLPSRQNQTRLLLEQVMGSQKGQAPPAPVHQIILQMARLQKLLARELLPECQTQSRCCLQ